MSDTQKIVETMLQAAERVADAMLLLSELPASEREAIRAAGDMLLASGAILQRRLLAHANALMETI